jgi:opacity protein-like surface antigen
MKKILLLIVGLVVATSAAQAQWVAQPIDFLEPDSTLVYSLDVLDANVAWASSYNLITRRRSTFLVAGYEYARTTDGGTTWTTAEVDNLSGSEFVTSIRGISATMAYACVLMPGK